MSSREGVPAPGIPAAGSACGYAKVHIGGDHLQLAEQGSHILAAVSVHYKRTSGPTVQDP